MCNPPDIRHHNPLISDDSAMAASSSPALVFVLLSAALSTLAAVSSATPGGSITLRKACNKTEFPDLCVGVLSSIPESQTASPRRLSELAFGYLTEQGPVLKAEAQRVTAATRNQSMLDCLREYNANIAYYVAVLRGAAEFSEAKRRLHGILDYPSNSGISCTEDEFKALPVTARIGNYEAMMQVTLDLMLHAAPRSHRAPPGGGVLAPAPWMARAPSETNTPLYSHYGR